jgi:hypothetical protein
MNMTAYDQGISDFHAGRYRNPYIAGSRDHHDYQCGYRGAEQDFVQEVTGQPYHDKTDWAAKQASCQHEYESDYDGGGQPYRRCRKCLKYA